MKPQTIANLGYAALGMAIVIVGINHFFGWTIKHINESKNDWILGELCLTTNVEKLINKFSWSSDQLTQLINRSLKFWLIGIIQ